MPIVDPQDMLAELDALRAENRHWRQEAATYEETLKLRNAENERLQAALEKIESATGSNAFGVLRAGTADINRIARQALGRDKRA